MHEKNREYNGYSNYETWNFMLWAGNDEPLYKLVQKAVKRCKELGGDISDLANDLNDITHEEAPELKTSFYSDVMMASVREVNYHEVAKHLLEEQQPPPLRDNRSGITKGEEMKLTKEDKRLLIKALSNLEQSVYNWSDEYVDTINKEYKSNILDAIDKLETKIINNK